MPEKKRLRSSYKTEDEWKASISESTARLHNSFWSEKEKAIELLNSCKFHVTELLKQGYPPSTIRALIAPLKEAAASSPFIHRAQVWPSGYPGDYETIQKIIDGRNDATPGTVGYWLEDFFLNSPICQQHRNKIIYQAGLIKAVATENADAKILSIGCGSSHDLFLCLPLLKKTNNIITVVDTDDRALLYSQIQLACLGERVSVCRENIVRLERSIRDRYDLVLIGGVFDYLSDRVILMVLKKIARMVADNGTLFFTNIAQNNPYRIYMEYLANWNLIERSENDLHSLLRRSGVTGQIHIEKDKTGLTYLVSIGPEHRLKIS